MFFFWRFRLAILLAAVAGAMGGLAWRWLTPPVYEVTSSVPVVIRGVDGAGWDTVKVDSVYTGLLELMQSNLVFTMAEASISPEFHAEWQQTWSEDTYVALTSETFVLTLRSKNTALADEFLAAWSQSVADVLNDSGLRAQAVVSPGLVQFSDMQADLWVGQPEQSILRQVSPDWLEAGIAGCIITLTTMVILLLFRFCLVKEIV